MLLARIYEVFPLICPKCGGTMKIIAFIDEGEAIREILTHLGEPVDPPCVAPARGPPLWEAAGQCGDDLLIQPLPEYEFDQRIAWGDVVSGPLTLPDGRVRVCYPENERRRAFSG